MKFSLQASLLFSLLFLVFGLLESTAANDEQGVANPSPADPIITIINTSSQDKAYDVETDSGAPSSAFQSCVGCLTVGAGQTVHFHPGPWNGALTSNHHTGTRFEVNFLASPGQVWYDADMEFGMSDETLGPTDNRSKDGGGSAIAGEQDTLAKANAAWPPQNAGLRDSLLTSGYVQGDQQRLTAVRMDKAAPPDVVGWLQVDADFNAYIGPGSVQGKQATAVDHESDRHTTFLATNKMTITIY